jgi:hypothetical protein
MARSLAGCLSFAILVVGCSSSSQNPKATSKNLVLVGTNDLQARSSYQPTVQKQGSRYILYVGHHTLATAGEGNDPSKAALPSMNPLTGKNEENGTSLVDVTDPTHPQYLAHIPVADGAGGGAQMVRVCDGNLLGTQPIGNKAAAALNDGKFYMLRSYHSAAHEIWDTTDPSNPKPVLTVAGGNALVGAAAGTPTAGAATHKSWWECDSGLGFIVFRGYQDSSQGWAPSYHVWLIDLSNPSAAAHSDIFPGNSKFLRHWALDGQQPGGKTQPHFTNKPAIHGPISTGVTGGRVFFAYGTGSSGVMQVVDRSAMIAQAPAPYGTGTVDQTGANSDYKTAELSRWIMNPDNGAHTSFPLGKLTVSDFTTGNGNDTGNVRDVVAVTSEATGNFCNEVRHMTYFVDITDPGRPQGISTFLVPSQTDGNCDMGGRFGPHSTNEEMGPPYYGKVIYIAYFNGGIRAVDIRNPYNPTEVGFYVPAIKNAAPAAGGTDTRCGPYQGTQNVCRQVIQTNNVATDDRGYVYIVDRANTGLHILKPTGDLAQLAGVKL